MAVFALLCALPVISAAQLQYVVIVSRHGVRSPTWDAARLNQYSAEPWPDWQAPPGNLTAHGRRLIELLGAYYREWLAHEGLFANTGCGDAGRVYIWADTDQRTLETGRAFAQSVAPGCGVTIHSRPEEEKDVLFSGVGAPDPRLAADAVRRRLGANPAKLLADRRTALETLQSILTGGRPAAKKLFDPPGEIGVAMQGKAIELEGPFAPASTLSENLLLEYTDGMQGAALGWGRLTKENLFRVLELHRVYADLMRRTAYLARTRGSNLLAHVLASLEQAALQKPVAGAIGPPGTAVLILAGHDTNLSNLSGMLDLFWSLPGYQPDDTPPGGALIFALWRDPAGALWVRTRYVAQTVDQMRHADRLSLAAPPGSQAVAIPGCEGQPMELGCPWSSFLRVAGRAIDPAHIDFTPAGAK